jgi:hypothetical protein
MDPALAWDAYLERVDDAQRFHHQYAGETDYHDPDRTYVFYGTRRKTFKSVRWRVQNPTDQLTWSDVRSCPGGPGDRMTYRNIVKVRRGIRAAAPFLAPSAAGVDSTMIVEPAHVQGRDGDGDETVPLESGSAPGKRISNICQLHGFDHQYAFDNHIARAFTVLTICKLAKHSDCKARLP